MTSTSGTLTVIPDQVLVHPLVLLSVVDHYKRVSLAPGKRVLGVLLGYWTVPFEENEQDPSVWYVDHNYHENMSELYKKVNAKEKPVGWYHSGPKLRTSDLIINSLFQKYCASPVLCIVDPQAEDGLPVQSYVAVDELREDGTTADRTFVHVASGVEAEEAEAVGVEHLLRDIKDGVTSNLMAALRAKTNSLQVLDEQLAQLDSYLEGVETGRLPSHPGIMAAAQNLLNLLPNVQAKSAQLALTLKTNDQMAMIYVGALARAAIALNELIANKMEVMKAALEVQQNGNPIESKEVNPLDIRKYFN